MTPSLQLGVTYRAEWPSKLLVQIDAHSADPICLGRAPLYCAPDYNQLVVGEDVPGLSDKRCVGSGGFH